MSTALPPDSELYSLYCLNEIPLLEQLFSNSSSGLLASMLSGYYLRQGDSVRACAAIARIARDNIEERLLKLKTLQLLKEINAPLLSEPRVHLLVLTCNRIAYVHKALCQLAATAYTNYAVYILDNGSSDGTWEIAQKARELFPESVPVHIQRVPFNTGRPVGHNLLLTEYDHSDAEFLAIADDDLVEIPTDWMRRMVRTAQCFPDAAVVGGKALSPGPLKSVHGSARLLTSFSGDELETTNRAEVPDLGQFDYVDKVDHVIGCLHLYRRAPLFSDIGLFDIRYSPCQCVDIDHHFRARLLGYEVIYNGLIEFVHARAMGKSADQDRALKGNALGNLAKLIYKFDVAAMNTLIRNTQQLREAWLAS